MELDQALLQIAEIRRQMARGQVFRGYRSATTAFSGGLGVAAAIAQAVFMPEPMVHTTAFLSLWLVVAVLSLAVLGVAMVWRCRRAESVLQRDITLLAVEQFLPCLVAGGLLTYVIVYFCYPQRWMLPGLWAIMISQGVFASRRLLTRPVVLVAGYYLLAGLLCLALAHGPEALSPVAMGVTFGGGQLLAAGVLYWTLERRHE